MKVLLIDADSVIPNLALMKLSSYHKNNGDDVSFKKLPLRYYPKFIKHTQKIDTEGYDKTYCSVVYEGNIEYIKGSDIIFGGSGYSLDIELPTFIENLDPDYSIYPYNNYSYGFISRGCIRNCYFCKVPKKEGAIRQVNTVNNIIKHNTTIFLDNNFLALKNHKDILLELIEIKKGKMFEFNQGLDIRLLDEENSTMLRELVESFVNRNITFAFDNWAYLSIMEEKIKLLDWRKESKISMYVYVDPGMAISETINRLNWCKEKKLRPYIMRDLSCWADDRKDFYTDIAAYTNQLQYFKSMSFGEFLNLRHTKKERINKSLGIYLEGGR